MILGICGAGGLGREVFDLAKTINEFLHSWDDIVFVETATFIEKCNDDSYYGKLSLYTQDELTQKYSNNDLKFVVAVGEPVLREKIANNIYKAGYHLETLIHPTAVISPSAKIGEGAVIQAFSFVSCDVSIAENVFLQGNALVGHDVRIGKNSVLSSHSVLAGHVTIGDNTYIGLNVPVKEGIIIGDSVIIGMGSVVTHDIPDNTIALGNPARPMKNNDEKKVFK